MLKPFEIPIFPLPDVVFFPETVLPLHVFEPRYRRMVADCLAGQRRLAVVMLRPGWEPDYHGRPPVHEVAGLGEIVHAEALAGDRYNILLDGRMRVRIEAELPRDVPYRVVRARQMPDVLPAEGAAALRERLLTIRAVHGKLLDVMDQGHADVFSRLTVAGMGPGAVVDRIVSAVVPDAPVRQRILETAEVSERLALAMTALFELLTLVAGSQSEDREGEDEERAT